MRIHPPAMLVDLDDTIIDYGGGADAAWRTVCAAAAQNTAGLDAEALLAAVARVRRWYWADPTRHREGRADLRAASRRIVQQALLSLGHDRPDLAETTADAYRALRNETICLFPGAVAALERLRQSGARLALLTNGSGPDQRAKIERFDLARHFDHIQIEGEFGCGKPEEKVYLAAMEALGSRPDDTWCVGDNLEWDVAAPQRLGLYAVWVDAKRQGLPDGATVRPHRIIHSFADLI